MSVRNLDSLFNPTHVAVVGAGGERTQLGHIVLRNLVDASFEGVVYPINPSRESVGGIQAYASIAETPAKPELAIVCTPAAAVPEVVRECGEAGVAAIAVLSAGFREAGAEGAELERRVAEELARHDGLRLLGPNCIGLIVPRLGLNASFAGAMPIDGHVAFVSQSGALATSVIDWALAEQIGFSHVVSLGNMLDIDLGDLIDYLGQDTQTRSIFLYIETVTEPRKFMSAARAFARSKPIIVYKAGRFAASAKAAVSHTGAMAGEDAVYDAAFRRAGLVRVERIEDVFASAELLARERPVRRGRLAIVTNAGGPGVMAADALLARGGALAELGPATLATLDAALPPAWSHANPIDVLGDAPPQRFGDAVKAALADTQVDAVLVILTPQAMTDAAGTADAVLAARRDRSKIGQQKPLLAAWMGGRSVREGLERLSAGGVATYAYPEQAVGAFMDLVSYARNLETLHETPRTIPVSFALDRGRAKELMGAVLAEGRGVLSETSSKTLLDAYEIPVTKPLPALSADDAVAVAADIGYPVALKVRSPDVTHKTDVGGVELGLGSGEEVRAAYERILASVREHRPEADVQGVTVQPMARSSGYELVLGARKDPTFGAVILLGAGGVAAELLARPGARPAAAERAPRARHAPVAADLAAARRPPRTLRDRPRRAARGRDALLLPRRRLPRDQRDRDQSAARRGGRLRRARRQGRRRPVTGRPPAAALLAPGDPALPRGVHARGDHDRRPARDAASDQAGGRAALARDARRLLARVDPVALPRDGQAHARVRHALLLHRLRPRARDRRRARSAGRHAQAPRRRPARRRSRPPERRVRGARRRSLAGARPVGPADRLLPARSRERGASAGCTRRRRPTTHA